MKQQPKQYIYSDLLMFVIDCENFSLYCGLETQRGDEEIRKSIEHIAQMTLRHIENIIRMLASGVRKRSIYQVRYCVVKLPHVTFNPSEPHNHSIRFGSK